MKYLLKEYLKLFYITFGVLLKSVQRRIPAHLACHLQNIFLFFHASKLRFYYDRASKLFYANEGNTTRYFGDMRRGFDLYARSLSSRGNSLAATYCLQHIEFDEDDLVIDCGANYADLFIFLDGRIREENYITFEPGPTEHKCITKSLPKARSYNLGLSDKDTESDFYLCSASADSGLIEPKFYTDIVKVRVTTLDNFSSANGIDKCKLLKLEAEGSEPEILYGARDFIKCCQYVAIDGGRERGVSCDLTFHTLNNYLINSGFEMIDMDGGAYRALYKNVKQSESKT